MKLLFDQNLSPSGAEAARQKKGNDWSRDCGINSADSDQDDSVFSMRRFAACDFSGRRLVLRYHGKRAQ
jgi:hypothetical protein